MDDKPVTAEDLAAVSADLQAYVSWARDAGLHELGSGAPPLRGSALAGGQPPATPPGPAQPDEARAPARSPGAAPAPSAAASAAAIPSSTPASERASVKLPTLQTVLSEIGDNCTRCKLHKGRTKLVFGVGNPRAKLVFVGEAPGEDEDLQGEPFVGKAGQLLTKMIQAMGLQREDVYICNTVKCRPPNNRNPEPDELASCEPFLKGQLAALQPEVIVTLGKFAAQALLREQSPISRLRGTFREYEGIALMPTFHPAYLLRSPGEKGKVWSDLQQVMRKLGLPLQKGGSA